MGCVTGYVVREASGEVLSSSEKWGAYEVQGTRELDALVVHVREIACPLEWDTWICCGLCVDLAALEVRFHGCAYRLSPPEIGAALSRVREAIGHAYRVSYAWEGRHELARLAGAPCAPEIEPIDPSDERKAVERLAVESREVEGLRWDPIARNLQYPYYVFEGGGAWVTIIAEDGAVHDVGFNTLSALSYLLASGPEVLAQLQAEIPAPIGLSPPREHAIFDQRTRRVSLWSTWPCVTRTGWEDWSFERLVTDIGDHLARTGRRLADERTIVADAPGDLRPVLYTPLPAG